MLGGIARFIVRPIRLVTLVRRPKLVGTARRGVRRCDLAALPRQKSGTPAVRPHRVFTLVRRPKLVGTHRRGVRLLFTPGHPAR